MGLVPSCAADESASGPVSTPVVPSARSMTVVHDDDSSEDVPLNKLKLAVKPAAAAPAPLPAAKPKPPSAAAAALSIPAARPAPPKQSGPAVAAKAEGKPVTAGAKAAIPPPKATLPPSKAAVAAPPGARPAAKPHVAPLLKRPRPAEEAGGGAPKAGAAGAAPVKPTPSANDAAGSLKRKESDARPPAPAASAKAPKPAAEPAAPKPAAAVKPKPPAPKPAAKGKVIDDDDESSSDSGSGSESDDETSGSDESGSDDAESSSEGEPIGKQIAAKKAATAKAKASAAPAVKKRPTSSPRKRAAKKDDDDEDDHNLIDGDEPWFQDKDDVNWKKGAVKWRTLEHAGVLFPPAYVRHNVPLLYAGAAVALTSEQEECATWYAAMKDSDFGLDPKFQENFFDDWRKVLVKTAEGKAVKEFGKCDFSRIAAHVKAEDAKRKDRSKDDKEADRALKTAQEARFMYALIDGRKEKVGNFRVEPPGLFRGRGDHPKRGRVKKRIFPEDITINIGDGAPKLEVPDMGDGRAHKWSAIVNDNKVTWLAKWKDSINGQDKCVWLAANSAWKGMSDMAKYNKARTLKLHIERVRRDYAKGMKDGALKMQQRSVAVYLIDQLALRVGNEKNTDEEADTVGCCSLRVEHVKLHADNKLELHFLGKDSIEFHNTVEIAPQAHALIASFLLKKRPDDDLFEQIKPQDLNEYFHEVMDGLTAKVFRTFNASITLDRLLSHTAERVTAEQIAKEGRETALINFYSVANKEVAELCNHQRAAPKNFDEQMSRVDERIDKLREELKVAKKSGSAAKIEAKERQLEKIEADKRTRIELKNVALGTSRINYNDPRITVAWCKAHDVPITKPFNKSLLSKFTWAMSTAPDWRF